MIGSGKVAGGKGYKVMTKDPVDLDEHRGMAAQVATDIRRKRLHEFQVRQETWQRRQEELETLLKAAPAETWREAATKAKFLIQVLATTPEAQDPRHRKLIANTLDDLARLSVRETKQ